MQTRTEWTFLGPNGNSLRSLPFQAPKKSWFSGPAPSNCPRNVLSPHQNHNGPRLIINRFINIYYILYIIVLLSPKEKLKRNIVFVIVVIRKGTFLIYVTSQECLVPKQSDLWYFVIFERFIYIFSSYIGTHILNIPTYLRLLWKTKGI